MTEPQPVLEEQPQYNHAEFQQQVARLWPHLFGPGIYVPLKIRIEKELRADAAARGEVVTLNKLRQFLAKHCSHREYLKALRQGGPRHGLVETAKPRMVSEEHMVKARAKLKKLQVKKPRKEKVEPVALAA